MTRAVVAGADAVAGSSGVPATGAGAGAAPRGRHPLDPEPVRCTKAGAVLALGIVATVTGFLVGGAIPGIVALVLARQSRSDMVAAKGYLTGVRMLRVGTALAWIGIVFALAAITVASIIGIFHYADHQGGGTA